MRALRLRSRSRRRRICRAPRRVTASEDPSLGLRPSGNMRTPIRMIAIGAGSGPSLIRHQPMDVVPIVYASAELTRCAGFDLTRVGPMNALVSR